MSPLASDIRANIASLQQEIQQLRKSAKRDLGDSANLRKVSGELRMCIARVKDLERNLVTEEANPPEALSCPMPSATAAGIQQVGPVKSSGRDTAA
jgi:hypothetical protein